MKSHHVIFIAVGAFAAGWIINNLAYSGKVTPLFPTTWFPTPTA
jgi:hypothetical protein